MEATVLKTSKRGIKAASLVLISTMETSYVALVRIKIVTVGVLV
jgi:hypothetical protein